MDWLSAKHWPRIAGVAASALLVLAMAGFDLNDPTFTNLREHSQGIGNWLGLPGALLGGSLVEAFGSASLVLPVLLLNFTLSPQNRPRLPVYLGWTLALTGGLSALHGLWIEPVEPGLADPGLLGWSLRYWAALTTGPVAASLILGVVILTALNRVAFHPIIRKALADARIFMGWSLRAGMKTFQKMGRTVKGGARRSSSLAGNLGNALAGGLAAFSLGLAALALTPFRAVVGMVSAWRMPSVGKVKARMSQETGRLPASRGLGVPDLSQPGEIPDLDPFDVWMAQSIDPKDSGPDSAPGLEGGAETTSHHKRSIRTLGPSARTSKDLPKDLAALLAEDAESLSGPDVPEIDPGEPAFPQALGQAREPLEHINPDDPSSTPSLAEQDTTPAPSAAAPPASSEDVHFARDMPSVPSDRDPVTAAIDDSLDFVDESYAFDQPDAEDAWRTRFQRYARNLDLDWNDQIWGESAQEDQEAVDSETEGDLPSSKD